MISNILKHRLDPIFQAERSLRRNRITALAIGVGCLLGLIMWLTGIAGPLSIFAWLIVTIVLLVAFSTWFGQREIDAKALSQELEKKFPELDGRLLTAIEQEGEELGYLQERVVMEAVDHSVHHFWDQNYRRKQRRWAVACQGMSLLGFLVVSIMLFSLVSKIRHTAVATTDETVEDSTIVPDIEVTPGNTEVEKGSKLVVQARFSNGVPSTAAVEMISVESGEVLGKHEMRQNLGDPVFATVVPRISEPVRYRIAFSDANSDTFEVGIYVHPKLEQADVTVTPPEYAEQDSKTVKDVRKVTALEGSELAFEFKVNKPISAAELFGEDESIIPLDPSPEDPTKLVATMMPKKGQRYRLHLVDDKDRGNKTPPWFTVKLKRNQPPKLELAFPGRDTEVSALEEMAMEGKVWDDLGVLRVGAQVSVGEKSADLVLTEEKLPGNKKHDFATLLALEDYEAQPTQLVSYHFWAEDIGPDGKPRRTESDMFFAEVRHWDHIFREGTQQGGEPGEPGQQSAAGELRKQQKEIMNATWKVMRRAGASGIASQLDDVEVIRQSQEIVAQNVDAVIEEVQDAQLKSILLSAKEKMGEVVTVLQWVIDKTDDRMDDALKEEKAVYQLLLQAESRETEVTQSQSQQPPKGQGEQKERQMMQLDLKQKEDRYETESKAEEDEPVKTEQAEDLAVLARLKELARRQEALAEKIKEVEAALKEAKTQEEKDELDRQLKRLKEEQEELLRDVDSLMERMDTEQNSERMAEEREKLAETREEVQKTNEQLKKDELAEAANSATRAERELSEMQEEFRKKTSSQFAEDMKAMRKKARELANSQEEIGEKFETAPNSADPFDGGDEKFNTAEVTKELQAQKQELEKLLKDMQQVSEAAEDSEPVLADELYEAVRNARTQGIEESLEEASVYTRYGRTAQAQTSEREAARAMEKLKEGVEKAAEAVLGDEAEALRMARNELDRVIESLEQEVARNQSLEDPDQSDPSETDGMQRGSQGEGEVASNEAEKGVGESLESKPGKEGESQNAGEEGQRGKGEEPGDSASQMAENSKGKGQGEQPGDEEGDGKQQGEMAENGKGKGQEKSKGKGQGEQPGGEEGEPSEMAQNGEQPGQGKGKGKGQGEQPGGEEGDPSEMAQNGEQPGQGKGKGQGKGEQPGEGEGKGKGQGSQMAQNQNGQESSQGKGQGQQPSQSQSSTSTGGGTNGGGGGDNWRSGGDDRSDGPGPMTAGGPPPMFFDQIQDVRDPGPLMGEDWEKFADGLRKVEEVMETPELRSEAAKVLDRARGMKMDYERDDAPPKWDLVQTSIVDPLVELRKRVSEELARKEKDNPLVPIDRDPVPGPYRELVRKYYEKLASGE